MAVGAKVFFFFFPGGRGDETEEGKENKGDVIKNLSLSLFFCSVISTHVRVAPCREQLLVRRDLKLVDLERERVRVGEASELIDAWRVFFPPSSSTSTLSSQKKNRSLTYLRVRVLQRPVADPRGRLPEADGVVVSRRGEDDLGAHRGLVKRGGLFPFREPAWLQLQAIWLLASLLSRFPRSLALRAP